MVDPVVCLNERLPGVNGPRPGGRFRIEGA